MFRKKIISLLIIAVSVFQIGNSQTSFEGLKEINGTHLFVKVVGQGEPLLIIHGGPCLNHNYFIPHLDALEKKYQLIYYDQRSAGGSDLSVKALMNVKQFTEDIEAIRNEFSIEKLNILCHSWSSILAANYCILYPEHVNSIIFCNPSPLSREFDQTMNKNVAGKTNPTDSLERARIIASDGFGQGNLATVDTLMRLNFRTVFCDTSKIAWFDAKLPENYLVASLSLQGLMYDLKSINLYDTLKSRNLAIPVLIISGNCDIIPQEAYAKLAGCFPNAQMVTFANSGHYPFIEENKLFLKTVMKFLKKAA